MSELSYRDEAASAYDRAFAHVSTHFLSFLLQAAHLEPGQRVLDAATGTGIAAEGALAVVGRGGHVTAAAPRVLCSTECEQRELEPLRTVMRNSTERLRAGFASALVF
jgi:protein-L-isoaspartate O-methyltransferase